MTETSHPSLLDELRRRAEALRKQQAAARLPQEEARQAIDGALWRAFRWLDEAVGHLGVIRPEVAHRFRLADYLTIDQPRFDSGFASFRRYGLGAADGGLEHVEMFLSADGCRADHGARELDGSARRRGTAAFRAAGFRERDRA